MILLLLLNFGISWWNAHAVGKAWVEANHAGGWPRLIVWAGAVMSASGFTWVYLLILALGAQALGYLDLQATTVAVSLGYLVLIPAVVMSGLVIMADSWARAYRERSVLNMGLAAYNTFAQAYNTYHAFQDTRSAWGSVAEFFKGDEDDWKWALVLLLVVIALAGGVLTTATIVRRCAATEPLPALRQRMA